MTPEHTPIGIREAVRAALHATPRNPGDTSTYAIDLAMWDASDDGDIIMWTGGIYDTATGRRVAHYTVADHWPEVDIHWL